MTQISQLTTVDVYEWLQVSALITHDHKAALLYNLCRLSTSAEGIRYIHDSMSDLLQVEISLNTNIQHATVFVLDS